MIKIILEVNDSETRAFTKYLNLNCIHGGRTYTNE